MKNISLVFLLFLSITVIYSQSTYNKISIGNWNDPDGWENGMVPSNPIEQNSIVNIAYRTFIKSDITNFGQINIIGDASQYLSMTSPVIFINNGDINNESYFEIRNKQARLINNGNFNNNNFIRNYGTIDIGPDAVFVNTSNSSFYNWGTIAPEGIIICTSNIVGTINNTEGGIFCNDAGFNNSINGSELGFGLLCFNGGNYNDNLTNMAQDISTCEIVSTEDIAQNLSDLITIAPNPVQNSLRIETQISLDGIQIYSALGRLIISSSKLEQEFDTSSLLPGIYFVQIKSGNNRITKMFIKQ